MVSTSEPRLSAAPRIFALKPFMYFRARLAPPRLLGPSPQFLCSGLSGNYLFGNTAPQVLINQLFPCGR